MDYDGNGTCLAILHDVSEVEMKAHLLLLVPLWYSLEGLYQNYTK